MQKSSGIKKMLNGLFGMKKSTDCAVHNCREIADKFMLILDKELEPEEENKLIQEINSCPGCLKHYNLDKAFKEYLQLKVDKRKCSGQVIHSIKQQIKEQTQ